MFFYKNYCTDISHIFMWRKTHSCHNNKPYLNESWPVSLVMMFEMSCKIWV